MKAILSILSVSFFCAFSSSAAAQGQLIYSEDFETGAPGWTTFTEGSSPFSLWAVSTAVPETCTGAQNKAAIYRNSGNCNYNNGFSHDGVFQSPIIQLPSNGVAPWVITWKHFRSSDSISATTIEIFRLSTSTVHVISGSHTNTSVEQALTASIGTWLQPGEQIRLRLGFSENTFGNQGFGWCVTEVKLESSGTINPTIAAVNPTFAPNSGVSGVQIVGDNFSNVTNVRFAGVDVPYVVLNPGEIEANIPSMSATGYVPVDVITSSGSGTLSNAFALFTPPTQIGSPCGPFSLTTSGAPILGQSLTFEILGGPTGGKNFLFVDYSNVPPPSCGGGSFFCKKALLPMAMGCPPPFCGIVIGSDLVLNLGVGTSYTANIANDPGLIGVQLSGQGMIRENGCMKSTQGLKFTIEF